MTDGGVGLSVKDLMTLELERQRWRYDALKEAEIRLQFSESSTRYYQRLAELVDRPEALAHDPVLVRRLQRLRDQRRAARGRRTSA